MKNLLYLLFVLPLMFSCNMEEEKFDEVNIPPEEDPTEVYYIECCDEKPVWKKYDEQSRGLTGKDGYWWCDEYGFKISSADWYKIKPSRDVKQEVKDIDGNIHNVYVMHNRTTDRDFWESDLKDQLKRE